MKKLLILLTLSVSLQSFAYEKYVCQEYDRETTTILERTIVLTPTGKPTDHLDENGDYESTKIAYYMEIFKGVQPFSFKSMKGFVYTEDVFFQFKDDKSELSFKLYLDEMEEGYLNVTKDSKTIYFVCR